MSCHHHTSASDLASQSNVDTIRQTHISLDLRADFEKEQLIGHAVIKFVVVADKATEICLDTHSLNVKSVRIVDSGEPATFRLSDPHKVFGRALVVEVPGALQGNGSEVTVAIEYETAKAGGAIQWLPPAQTEGKKHPFLFTQYQAIHARSFLLCQDTPGA